MTLIDIIKRPASKMNRPLAMAGVAILGGLVTATVLWYNTRRENSNLETPLEVKGLDSKSSSSSAGSGYESDDNNEGDDRPNIEDKTVDSTSTDDGSNSVSNINDDGREMLMNVGEQAAAIQREAKKIQGMASRMEKIAIKVQHADGISERKKVKKVVPSTPNHKRPPWKY